jgi:hypothetical protein
VRNGRGGHNGSGWNIGRDIGKKWNIGRDIRNE